jgi:hypothetical protein
MTGPMTGPNPETEGSGARPLSVAELLARNGTIGAPANTRRRRRRRGDDDAVTVAELTGELPVIGDDDETDHATSRPEDAVAERVTDEQPKTGYWSEPEPRWPKSPPQPQRATGPERSAYPRPPRQIDTGEAEQSGAEDMSPDPLDHYADTPVDVMDSDVREAELATEDSAYVRSYLQASDSTLFGGQTLADELARRRGGHQEPAGSLTDEERDEDHLGTPARRAGAAEDAHPAHHRLETLWRGGLIVLQSILAVAFGAGLFIAFDQLWRWNSLVALVLSVLVILGLVAGVRVVRKTEDIASTLIAVAVGALITLGPLALSLQSG